jgi:hypothetical protein
MAVSTRGAWLVLALTTAFCALPIVFILQDMHTQSELARSGVSGRARVTRHRIFVPSILAERRRPEPKCYLTLEYTPGGSAAPRTADVEVDWEFYKKSVDGDDVDVRYLPYDTGTIIIVRHTRASRGSLVFAPLYLAFPGLIATLMICNWLRQRRKVNGT